MKYLTLAPNYVLRGWSNLKYALVNIESNQVSKRIMPLTDTQFNALELITSGGISPDDNLIPVRISKMADWAYKNGILIECCKDKKPEDYQKYHYTNARFIQVLLWSITGNCNLKCKHCYISAGENCYGELSFEKCNEVIRQLKDANVEMVALTGGEPLVRKDFWQLVDLILENHIKILQIFTNGLLINEKFMNEFESRNIDPNYFMVSFDGVGCHDWLRGVNGAEKAAVDAIKLIRSKGYEVVVSTALHMGNINSLTDTYELMKELGVYKWKAVPMVDTGNWKKQDDHNVNYDIVYNEYLKLLKKYKEDGMPFILGLGGFFLGSKHNINGYQIPFANGCGSCERNTETLCEATVHLPYLLPDGRVLPCIAMSGSVLEDIAPNIFDENYSMEKALSDSPIDTYTKYTYEDLFAHNKECAECEYKFICSGCRANALTLGGYFEKDIMACRFFKGGYENKIRKIMN